MVSSLIWEWVSRTIPPAVELLVWQPEVAQLLEKMGSMSWEKLVATVSQGELPVESFVPDFEGSDKSFVHPLERIWRKRSGKSPHKRRRNFFPGLIKSKIRKSLQS